VERLDAEDGRGERRAHDQALAVVRERVRVEDDPRRAEGAPTSSPAATRCCSEKSWSWVGSSSTGVGRAPEPPLGCRHPRTPRVATRIERRTMGALCPPPGAPCAHPRSGWQTSIVDGIAVVPAGATPAVSGEAYGLVGVPVSAGGLLFGGPIVHWAPSAVGRRPATRAGRQRWIPWRPRSARARRRHRARAAPAGAGPRAGRRGRRLWPALGRRLGEAFGGDTAGGAGVSSNGTIDEE
jgi:hypothetical protein